MSYCIKCGRKLVDRYLENEGVRPYCENCKEYRFKMYNVAISMIVIAPNNKILLIKQYHKNDYILVAGYVNYQESIESALKRELKEELNLEHLNIKHLDTIIYPYNNYIFNIYLIEDEIDINNIVYDFSEVVNIDWYTKEEIFNKIKEGKVNKGYAYILEKYI